MQASFYQFIQLSVRGLRQNSPQMRKYPFVRL